MRLAQYMKDQVIQAATSKMFKAREEAWNKEVLRVAEEIYRVDFGDAEKIAMKLPEDWRNMTGHMWVVSDNMGGAFMHNRLQLKKPRPFSVRGGSVVIKPGHLCYDTLQALSAEWEAIKTGKQDLKHKLNTLLNSVSTVKRLHEVWPEAKAFIPKDEPAMMSMLPVPFGLTKQLNTMLGLKAA